MMEGLFGGVNEMEGLTMPMAKLKHRPLTMEGYLLSRPAVDNQCSHMKGIYGVRVLSLLHLRACLSSVLRAAAS